MTTDLKKRFELPVTELEQDEFCQDESELRTKTLQEEFKTNVRWQRIPTRYMKLTPQQVDDGIASARAALGNDVFVLGHHYQRDDVIKYADIRGDSYLLSKQAAERHDTPYIIFCGVHFMAETADILTADNQKVILPNLMAGCSMADMAQAEDVEDAWNSITRVLGDNATTIPITYMNSTAKIKALCGANQGLVCTSSNATAAFEWAYERGERVLFLPDQHLGRNTGLKMGLTEDQMVVWSPFKSNGGLSAEQIQNAKLILWEGFCSVHTRFTTAQIETARAEHSDVNVIVHPECVREVVDVADYSGSTEYIRKTIESAPDNSVWAVGTEISMVKRLALENPSKTIFCLDKRVCPCATMYRIHPAYLLWILEGLRGGIEINVIEVPQEIKKQSRLALDRMLQIGG